MDFKLSSSKSKGHRIIGIYADQDMECEKIQCLKQHGQFGGKKGEIFCLTDFTDEMNYWILVGLGESSRLTGHDVKCAFAKAARKMKELKINTYEVEWHSPVQMSAKAYLEGIIEGIRLGLYTFDKYKSDTKHYKPVITIAEVAKEDTKEFKKWIKSHTTLLKYIALAREWGNEPANVLNPATLAFKIIQLGKEVGFKVEVLDAEAIEELGMGAFLAVGQSSKNHPKLIVMRYIGDKEDPEKLGLVGKGITCDTGGYCIKPADGMLGIKGDMAGAAAVVGAIASAAKNKVKGNVVGVIAACENKINDISYVPGDIITSMAGKTIEVINTDAEGRLTLADAMTYITTHEKVTKVVDIATLTGAVVGALGFNITGLLANDEAFYDEFMGAAKVSEEEFWRLPINDDYRNMIKSKVADLKNSGGRWAGTITAGLFVEAFTQGLPWIHLDIAGTAWNDSPEFDYMAPGATGAGVKTLYHLIGE